MEDFLQILKSVNLFKDIKDSDLLPLLTCLSAKKAQYGKGQTIFFSDEKIDDFGIVLSGQVQIVQEDYYGNRNIFDNIGVGNMFGESFACSGIKKLPVSIISAAESEVLFIDCNRLSYPCANVCDFHSKLIQNMLNIVSMKNILLTQKIEFTSKRTTKEKLLAFLSSEAKKAGSSKFIIPFNRQELADYLFVERSAMSAELSKLRDDGVLAFHKNEFELL